MPALLPPYLGDLFIAVMVVGDSHGGEGEFPSLLAWSAVATTCLETPSSLACRRYYNGDRGGDEASLSADDIARERRRRYSGGLTSPLGWLTVAAKDASSQRSIGTLGHK